MPAPRLHPLTDDERRRVGAALRTHRQAAGLRLIDVCDRLDLSPAHLANMEKGRRRVTPARLVELAGVYGVAVAEITGQGVAA